jgi:hypothetical protein
MGPIHESGTGPLGVANLVPICYISRTGHCSGGNPRVLIRGPDAAGNSDLPAQRVELVGIEPTGWGW